MGRGRVAGGQFGGRDAAMRPAELLSMASDRMSDPYHRAHVEELAARIKRQGYRSRQHDSNVTRPDLSSHIHVAYTDEDPQGFLMNGNHRAAALNLAGYRKPVPVRVTDLRTSRA